jgi:hypothetical protein
MSDLVLSYESTASIWPVSIVVGSMLITISVRGHHVVSSEWWDRVVTNLAQRKRVDIVISDARSDLDHGVRVMINYVSTIERG